MAAIQTVQSSSCMKLTNLENLEKQPFIPTVKWLFYCVYWIKLTKNKYLNFLNRKMSKGKNLVNKLVERLLFRVGVYSTCTLAINSDLLLMFFTLVLYRYKILWVYLCYKSIAIFKHCYSLCLVFSF